MIYTTEGNDKMNRSLYATRAATLEYQKHVGGGYEAARRDLTERMLQVLNGHERPHSVELHIPPSGLFDNKHPEPVTMRVRVQPEGDLMVITKIERV